MKRRTKYLHSTPLTFDDAQMTGVNVAEETQRIQGSTEMIGPQISSCNDES